MIQTRISIIIHTASPINLVEKLGLLSGSIIEASQMMVDLALTCPKFERFVYVSTAYANTHLSSQSHQCDLRIDEKIYEVRSTCNANVLAELEEVRKGGTSKAYEAENFPWAYAYAKNLTERLLQHKFSAISLEEKLLIVRPSVIGPSQCLPYPGYVMPMSSPCIVGAAFACLFPLRTMKVATLLEEPETNIYVDIVPVDVVVDRLLAHLALNTFGCVHAVSGVKSRASFKFGYPKLMKLRRIPWGIRPVWLNEDWKSAKQHWIPRLYGILGASFTFSEEKTITLSKQLPDQKETGLQLFTKIDVLDELTSWTESIRYVMDKLAAKSIFVRLILWIFYFDFGKSRPCRCR